MPAALRFQWLAPKPRSMTTFRFSTSDFLLDMIAKKSNRQLWLMLALIAIIAAVILLLPGCGGRTNKNAGSETEAATLVKAGDMAPDFTVEMFDGRKIALSDLRGKVTLLNFWATWCPPCRQELARAEADLIERFEGSDFVFLPISRGEQRDAVAAFRDKQGYDFPMGLDPDKAIYDLYATNYIPRNFLIGRDGKVISAAVGYEPEEFDVLVATIEQTLNEN